MQTCHGVDSRGLCAARSGGDRHSHLVACPPDGGLVADRALTAEFERFRSTIGGKARLATATTDERRIWIDPDDRGIELEIVAVVVPRMRARHPCHAHSAQEDR